MLPSFFATDPERLRRFDREARLLASLNHPHVGAIYGLEQTDGFSGLILELVLPLRRAVGKEDAETARHLLDAAEKRLTSFFGYLSVTNPRARFLVYSRGSFATEETAEAWLGDVIARFGRLKGRLFVMPVPGRDRVTFRDPATAELLRTRVREILALR